MYQLTTTHVLRLASWKLRRLLARFRVLLWLLPVLAISIAGAYLVRFDGQLDATSRAQLWGLLPLVVSTKAFAFLASRISLSCHAFVSLPDAMRLLRASLAATACVIALDSFWFTEHVIPRGVVVIDACFTTLVVGGILTVRRIGRERRERREHAGRGTQNTRVLIVGGPSGAELLLRAIRLGSAGVNYRPIGILTNASKLQNRAIAGIPVLGTIDEIEWALVSQSTDAVLLAGGDLPGTEVRRLMRIVNAHKVDVRVVPDVSRIVAGQIDFRPREVAIEDLLGRPQVQLDLSELKHWLAGKRLLVTGSCGSIGSELVRQLLQFAPGELVLVDRSENGQFHLGRELQASGLDTDVKLVLGDTTDEARMRQIFSEHQPQIVFHAAAYKHVPLMEANPGEGVKNIVRATKVLTDLAHESGVETFVMISTDKAVNPTSVMGCCKRTAELYVQSMAYRSDCKFVTVRFGNVLGSAGSVVPVFRQQIAKGGPLTVTHPNMTRYFMTIPEASQLVIQAAGMGQGGEIFVLDMGTPVKIRDLAEDMIRLSGLRVGHDIDIVYTGVREGEKLYEELYDDSEKRLTTSHSKILRATSIVQRESLVQQRVHELISMTNASNVTILTQLKSIVPSFQSARLEQADPMVFTHPAARAA